MSAFMEAGVPFYAWLYDQEYRGEEWEELGDLVREEEAVDLMSLDDADAWLEFLQVFDEDLVSFGREVHEMWLVTMSGGQEDEDDF